ncbi:MAG: NAD-dependent epimerase/dehydratase family protein [Candidatus Aenigmatarchaeota archaeon]
MTECHNVEKTCWNCPAAKLEGNVDFRGCGQSKEKLNDEDKQTLIECKRRKELGHFEPTIKFEQCPEWEEGDYGYQLKDMRVLILGMEGYLGWALALKLANHGFEVMGVDNHLRRETVSEKGSHSIVPIEDMETRLEAAKEVLGVDIGFEEMDYTDKKELGKLLKEFKPESIVHYAEIPSAPYSMVDGEHAHRVQENNTLGTLKLLWAMKEHCPEASLVKLGTMGEYGAPLTGRPLFEGVFPADAAVQWEGREWSLGGELTPRNPPSFYHVSKVQDTYNVYEACKYWWLRSYDIMQGVIFGVHTEEVSQDPRLRTRLDVDEWFGTVINRFVSQAVSDVPLTVYGKGEQARGFIGLEDAMQCMVRLINSPPEPGEYGVVNQVSGVYKIKELADAVADVTSDRLDKEVKIQRIENPRVESDKHPIEVVSRNLPNEFGFERKVELKEEIGRMVQLLSKDDIQERIEKVKKKIIPETQWSGEKKEPDIIEIYEPGTKDHGNYQTVLNTGR